MLLQCPVQKARLAGVQFCPLVALLFGFRSSLAVIPAFLLSSRTLGLSFAPWGTWFALGLFDPGKMGVEILNRLQETGILISEH